MLSDERKVMRDLILSQAKYFLEKFDEFYPFGSVIMSDKEFRPFGVSGGEDYPEVVKVIEQIERVFIDGVREGKYIAVSVAVDVLFTLPETGEKKDAIEIRMDSKAEGSINYYIPYRRLGKEVKFIEMYADTGTLSVF